MKRRGGQQGSQETGTNVRDECGVIRRDGALPQQEAAQNGAGQQDWSGPAHGAARLARAQQQPEQRREQTETQNKMQQNVSDVENGGLRRRPEVQAIDHQNGERRRGQFSSSMHAPVPLANGRDIATDCGPALASLIGVVFTYFKVGFQSPKPTSIKKRPAGTSKT